MSKCKHPQFSHELKLQWLDVRVGPVLSRDVVAILKITCSSCKEPYLFKGEAGWSTTGATTSLDGTELRAPMVQPSGDKDVVDIEKISN